MSQSYDELEKRLRAEADPKLWERNDDHGVEIAMFGQCADAIAALRQDAERLDWLDSECSADSSGRVFMACLPGKLRNAIDAAIAAAHGPKTTDAQGAAE